MKFRAALALICCTSGAAMANVITLDRTCVEIDVAADGLVEQDRARALAVFRQVLERENMFIVTSACSETYMLSHERDGDGYVIHVRNSAGARRMKMPSFDELTPKYKKLVRSLIEAKAAATEAKASTAAGEAKVAATPPAPASVNPLEPVEPLPSGPNGPIPATDTYNPALDQPSTSESVTKRRLWYLLYGFGVTGERAVTLGYRRNLDKVSIEGSFMFRENGFNQDATEGVSLAVEVLGRHPMSAKAMLYGGGGLSVGGAGRGSSDGEGVQGELTGGMDFGGSGFHVLAQLDVTVPFYLMSDGGYAPTLVISGGIGW